MKTFTKTGRKVIGALVTAAIVFSMIPAMFAIADTDPGLRTVTINNISNQVGSGGSRNFNGIVLAAPSQGSISTSKHFNTDRSTTRTYTIRVPGSSETIPLGGPDYRNGVITSISISGIDQHYLSGNQAATWANQGWTLSGSTLTWTGSSSSASLSVMGSNNSNHSHYLAFSSITVTVKVPITSVTLGNMNFIVGDSASAMSVTINPSNTTYSLSDITFTSSAESVAKVAVSEGSVMVTPVGVGTATISASYGDTALGQATVTVYSADDIIVNISPSTLRLAPDGDTAALSYSVSGASDHDWDFYGYTSDDSAIAYVDESTGEVLSGELGQTTITVWIYDYTAEKWVTAECAVTVSNDPEPSDEPSYTPEQLQRMATENFVERLYVVCLNRTYDVTGRDAWTDQLMAGGSATAVVQGFIGSPEFIGKNLSNEEFVTILYKVFFDRTPDAAGLNNWVSVLNSGTYSRTQVVNGFAQSPEWASYCARYSLNV